MRRIELPTGVTTFPNNLVPGGVEYVGVDGTVIAAANPDLQYVQIGPRTILRHLAIHDKFGTSDPLVMLPLKQGGGNAPRPVGYLENASDATMISTHWAHTAVYIHGGQVGIDSPVISVRNCGQYSAGIFAEAHERAYGFHAWALEQALGILIQAFGTGAGLQITGEPGSHPATGYLSITAKADNRSIHVQPAVDTDTDVGIVSDKKTHGHMLALYQAVSNFAGNGISINCGNGGTFTGRFLSCATNGVERFGITPDGDVVGGRLAQRLAALEAAVHG